MIYISWGFTNQQQLRKKWLMDRVYGRTQAPGPGHPGHKMHKGKILNITQLTEHAVMEKSA